ncbi:MAG: hypothetical protein KTR30_20770 [Saprospiraceae bacterium]|nr:hypothetical protein [Saprospiraceae bacterium]
MKKKTTKKKKNKPKQKENLLSKYAALWLLLISFILYLPSVNLGFTELDDTIFINEMSSYNQDPGNIFHSFTRGVFSEENDTYYRPLLLDSFIINAFFSKENIAGFHFVNILLHLLAVWFLFSLLQQLGIQKMTAFWLSLIFAVHPVLTQAVAWIPGRNDTLLAIFVFPFLKACLQYRQSPELKLLLLQAGTLLAALFTKETALFALPAAWLLSVFLSDKKWWDGPTLRMYAVWIGSAAVYLLARSLASLEQSGLAFGELIGAAFGRIPVLLAYFGKVFLPVNLSVFPMIGDMTLIYGIIATALVGALIFFSRGNNLRRMLVGFLVFVLFLIPALMVPDALNNQDFEHRLYVPMLGLLLLLSETILFKNKLSSRQMSMAAGGVALIFAVMSLVRMPVFNDPITFWSAAVESSPNSAYANMMLAARLDDTDMNRASSLMQKAYDLDPNQKYINYYMGTLQVMQGKLLESEPFFLEEIKRSDYYKCYSHLGQIAFQKQDPTAAIQYMEKYLAVDTRNAEMNNNLLMLYFQTNQMDKARLHAQGMQNKRLVIPEQFRTQLGM